MILLKILFVLFLLILIPVVRFIVMILRARRQMRSAIDKASRQNPPHPDQQTQPRSEAPIINDEPEDVEFEDVQ